MSVVKRTEKWREERHPDLDRTCKETGEVINQIKLVRNLTKGVTRQVNVSTGVVVKRTEGGREERHPDLDNVVKRTEEWRKERHPDLDSVDKCNQTSK